MTILVEAKSPFMIPAIEEFTGNFGGEIVLMSEYAEDKITLVVAADDDEWAQNFNHYFAPVATAREIKPPEGHALVAVDADTAYFGGCFGQFLKERGGVVEYESAGDAYVAVVCVPQKDADSWVSDFGANFGGIAKCRVFH